jgi:hypothetical protein
MTMNCSDGFFFTSMYKTTLVWSNLTYTVRILRNVVLTILEYVLFLARFIFFLFIIICSTRIGEKDILIYILDHHDWKPDDVPLVLQENEDCH